MRLAGLLLAVMLGACASQRPASVPMRTIAEASHCATRPDTLLVLLPGTHSLPEEFQREGFVQAVRERQLALDVLLVDAHRGYYSNRSIIDRLRADVMQPARAQGYRHIWLAGISLGSVGAMLYADAWPGEADGVVMLAPFLGSHLSAVEIRNAGGLAAWPTPVGPADGDLDIALWRWLQGQTSASIAGTKRPLHLGYGLDDRFAFNQAVLGEAMPAERVFTTEGGHDWPAWRALWARMLDVGVLSSAGVCRPG
jgi:pimeloyl-ACP methyl ester carboxylesterase